MKNIPIKLPHIRASVRALVDDGDYDVVANTRWCFNSNGYAISRRNGKIVRMHRLIMGLVGSDRKLQVDHINGNRIDNRRGNLRVCNNQQNSWNIIRKPKGVTGVVGVYANGEGFIARIGAGSGYNSTRKNLGTFKTKEEAQLAYNNEAKKRNGEFYCG